MFPTAVRPQELSTFVCRAAVGYAESTNIRILLLIPIGTNMSTSTHRQLHTYPNLSTDNHAHVHIHIQPTIYSYNFPPPQLIDGLIDVSGPRSNHYITDLWAANQTGGPVSHHTQMEVYNSKRFGNLVSPHTKFISSTMC